MCASRPRSRIVRSQRLAILEYARTHDIRIDDFIEATASGQASEKRRRLAELTSVLQRGDRLVVSEFSRLRRSLGQIFDALAKAGVAFVALKESASRNLAAGAPTAAATGLATTDHYGSTS